MLQYCQKIFLLLASLKIRALCAWAKRNWIYEKMFWDMGSLRNGAQKLHTTFLSARNLHKLL